MPKPLEALERDVLDYLVGYVRANTYQPSVREIGADLGIRSTKTVSEVIQSLEEKGWVERESARSRSLRLLTLDLDTDVVSVPHVDVHLGDPSLEEPLDRLVLDRRLAGTAGSFLVTMVGDSMVGEGIRDGDLLLVESTDRAGLADGELVVCRVGSETDVWRLRRREDGAVLVSGPDRPVVEIADVADEQIVGRVNAVLRQLRTDRPLGRDTADDAG
ncbi:MAG: LexA family protein [Candidatus Longimicrobiales bacterium M2_2A_002]